MWHNHKNHIGSPCRSVFDFLRNQCGKPENHIGQQNPKNRFIFAKKTEKPDGKKRKNRKPQRTTKPRKRSFSMQKPKNRPTKWPKLKHRKSQRPPPLSKNQWSFSFCFSKLFCADFFILYFYVTHDFYGSLLRRWVCTIKNLSVSNNCLKVQVNIKTSPWCTVDSRKLEPSLTPTKIDFPWISSVHSL